ncbi:hypothetical protein QTJ16_000008 [Diplocarpon rosae]|uniref:BZIP domain-containing protein n=1 Tax=Diplocarpon rosae TaxID=946125 RepID=A0AAD9T5F4_9HELO|nr:hypothetical protein QTJ16_000008 [Diplocarpon rosae]
MSAGAPHIKFEHSPADSLADSLISTPRSPYPSLFHHQGETMDPAEVMTPRSYEDDSMFGGSLNGSLAGTPAPEKKQVKKRKSWGQQLPEPKTNLPPRKRAKTEDEKEQRRVERVLRNRRAAQSSRERKRQEVEALEAQKLIVEQTNQDLLRRLQEAEAKNVVLQRQLEELGGGSMTAFPSSSVASSPRAAEPIRLSPRPSLITFSQTLFGPSGAEPRLTSTPPNAEPPAMVQTVNPASLSPEMGPTEPSAHAAAASSDLTQHPAAVLCDLPCQSEGPTPWTSTPASISRILAITLMISMSTQAIWTILQPLQQIRSSLTTGSSLSPTSSILSWILWITTQPSPLTTTRSTSSSSTTTRPPPRFSLRIRLLRRLLACNPHLARPLQDATVAMLRSASEPQPRDCLSAADASRRGSLPSAGLASLMTLLWTIERIERERTSTPQPDAAAVIRQVGAPPVSREEAVARGPKSVHPGQTAFHPDWP